MRPAADKTALPLRKAGHGHAFWATDKATELNGNDLQSDLAGVSMASILLMVALGLAIIYGAMGAINLAHGEFVMLGAYVTWAMQTYLGTAAALPVVFLLIGAIGWIIERTVVHRLYRRPLDTILATWGIGIVLQQLARMGVGPEFAVHRGAVLP